MDLSLRPETLAAIAAFRARHRSLLWRRGVLAALAFALSLFGIIALLDRGWLLPDAIRPWFSIAAYVACGIAAWRIGWQFMRESRTNLGAARMAEQVAPEVREKLLAAVELAEGDAAKVKDSPEFRARLQSEVGSAVRGIDWKKRQPASALVPWVKLILVTLVVIAALSFVPRLHLPGFMARAALPFANLERPSSVRITVEKPQTVESLAPMASEVDVAVKITGEPVDQAFIEFGEVGGSTRRMELGKVGPEHFEARLPVGQSDVRYRVRAADGMTAWHLLDARARPRIEQFVKTIVPPSYVGGEGVTLTEEHGDIEALDGSVVKLSLQCNQPITSAGIVLNPDMPTHPKAPIATVQEQTKVSAELVVGREAEAWTVKLKSAETGFTNDESASWRITSVADLPPIAQMVEPKETQISLMADESIRITGAASDDVGLASVVLAHSINGMSFRNTDLATKPGKQAEVQHLFMLSPLQLHAGDTVVLKIVATDLHGQKADSTLLRILIQEQTVDPRQRDLAAEQRRLVEMAKTLAEKTRDLVKDASQVQKVAQLKKKGKEPPSDAETKLARLQQAAQRTREQADDLWQELKKAAQLAPTKLDAESLKLLGESLTDLRRDELARLETHTQDGVNEPEMVKRAAAEAHGTASRIEDAARAFAAETTAKITAQATQLLSRQQALLTETSLNGNRDQAQRPKWQEQQRAALLAHQDLGQELDDLKEVQQNQQGNLERMKKEISEAANDLRESLDKPLDPNAKDQPQPKSPEHLYGASDNLRQRLQRNAEQLRGIASEAARRAADARQRLQSQDNPALVAIEEAKAALHEATEAAKNPKLAQRQKPDREGLLPKEKAEKQLAQASLQLQDQAELREQNPLTNSQAALDENRASRAAAKLADAAKAATKEDAAALEAARDQVKDLAHVARLLDADNIAKDAVEALNEAALERQPNAEAAQATAAAAQQAAEQLKQLPQAARRAEAKQELANTAQQAAEQARNAAQQLNDQARQAAQQQPNQAAPTFPKSAQLAEAKAKAEQVAAALATEAEGARQQLLAMAPKVSEMMNKVAAELRETQKKTEAAKQDADAQKPVAEVGDKAQAIQPEAAKNAEKMEGLQAALRQEANAAELAKADQRQLARTADVALEAMRQKTPQIKENLKQAAQAEQSQPQSQALQKAAQAQQQTADALQQLAQNFAKMEQGQEVPQEALAQLEQMEKDLGVQEPLNEAYDKAKELADVAQDAKNDPQKALAELEAQLKKSPAMQKALAEIAKDTAQGAEKSLAEKANQPAMLGSAAEEAGHHIDRVARHEQRLGKQDAAKASTEAAKQLQATAKATKTEPGNATPQVAEQIKQAAQAAAKSAEQAAAQTPGQPNISAFDQTQATALAQALDQLDAQLHPMNGGQQQQSSQQGQQQQQAQQGQQQNAQQSLSQAQQSQQQSMAQARAQGKVPGQSQSNQQTAQNKQQSQQDAQGQQSKEGGNFTQVSKDGKMVLVPIGDISVADWGKLPSRMAEDLTEATRQEAAPEYRAAIENYYKAIAQKAKK